MNYESIASLNVTLTNPHRQMERHIDRRTYAALVAAEAARKVETREDIERRVAEARAIFAECIGEIPYDPTCPLDARITRVREEEDLTIEYVIFRSRPGIYVTANVYIPKDIDLPAPAILFQPGHSDIGKASVQYQKVARTIARHGMIVMLMDPPGQGERLNYWVEGEDTPRFFGAVSDHDRWGSMMHLAGRTAAAYFLADARRAIDYLLSRPDVDPERIGGTGSSGGGTMTSALAVIEDRLAAVAPGTFVSSRDAITVGSALQDIEQMWPTTLARGFDHHELISSFCPKPYLILAVDADFFPIDGTYDSYEYGKECYRLMGKEDNLRLAVDRSKHAFTLPLAVAAGRFFAEVFGLPPRSVKTEGVESLSPEELFCTPRGQVLWDIKDAKPMWQEARELLAVTREGDEEKATAALRQMVGRFSTPSPANELRYVGEYNEDEQEGTFHRVMWQAERNLPVFGMLLTREPGKKQPVTVAILPNGMEDTTLYEKEFDEILNSGRTLLIANLTGRGITTAPAKEISRKYANFKADSDLLFLGDSLCPMLVRDVLGTVRVVKAEFGVDEVELFAAREASVWARIAARLDTDLSVRTKDEIAVSYFMDDLDHEHDIIYSVRAPGLARYLN